ncbi:MAG: site-2 protease family protein [Gemmataceae bacterium]
MPLFRVFRARVKIHALYLLAPLLFCRYAIAETPGITPLDLFFFIVLLPLPILLIHELGHLFAARSLGGDMNELVITPLGGLVSPPMSHPKADAIVAIAGPVTSVLFCIVLTSISVGSGYTPHVVPLADPVACPSIHAGTGRTHTVASKPTYYRPGTNELIGNPVIHDDGIPRDPENPERVLEKATLPPAIAWLWRANWLGIWLVIFNLAVWSVPLDAGRIVVALAESRTSDPFRAAVNAARFSILLCVPCLFFLAIVILNETLLLVLAAIVLAANARLVTQAAASLPSPNEEDRPFGYNFSEGYTSLESSDEVKPPPPPLGFWEKRRRLKEAERVRREAEQDQRDAARIDELLDKIQRLGKVSLTQEESAFLERMSLRYRDQA